MIGVYVGNSLSELSKFDSWLKSPADAVLGYIGRADWKDFVGSADWAEKLWSNTDKTVLWSVPLVVNGASLATAATGAYNEYYKQVAKSLAASQPDGEIHIRTGWEFNGQWFPWKAAGKEEAYVGAFREFVDAFRTVSDRFTFEWAPNIGDLGMNPEKAYPGDAYVDVIGMDFYYNTAWDSKNPENAWSKMVTQNYGLQWHQDFAAAHGKPTAYSEWGMMSDGAGAYVEKAADWFARYDVAYHTYWNSYQDFPGKLSDGHNPATGAEYRDEFGGAPKNIRLGGSGNDSLYGNSRGERLDGKAGADSMRGYGGDDTYYVDNSGDRVIESAGEGKDEIRSKLATTTLPDHVENLTLLSNGNQTGIGNELDNRIVGGTGNDTLDGREGNDRLMGGVGNDTFIMRPGGGRDTIADFKAGPGSGDVLRLDSFSIRSFDQVKAALEQYGGDTVLALPGGDVVVFANHKVADFAADDFAFGGSPPAPAPAWRPDEPPEAPTPIQYSRSGGGGNDVIKGGDVNDYINGGGGTDTMTGGKGHDTYVVDRPQDVIVEKSGQGIDSVDSWSKTYTLPANVENLALIGGYAQTVTGNALDNRLESNGSGDTLNGKAGDDWLIGGGGKDSFVFQKGTGHDTIEDFAPGSGSGDVARLEDYGWSSFSQVKTGMSQKGDDTLLTLPGGDTVLFLGTRVSQFAADDFQFAGVTTGGGTGTGGTGSGSSTITVRAAADSWNGNPLFRLTVDGVQVGKDTAVGTQRDDGWQEFTFTVTGNSSPDALDIRFLNDDYGGSAAADRNLYIDRVVVNGRSYDGAASLYERDGYTTKLGSSELMPHNGVLHFDLMDA
ncbi:carbohydrate-binding domain-containing protein [Azospirillum oleiclasticum]|nr:carbohydrate-binding domain-containing protein [Azospirillum oleiclasticum]